MTENERFIDINNLKIDVETKGLERLPLVNGHMLNLSDAELDTFEKSCNAWLSYKPGKIATNIVPIEINGNFIPNPIQVLMYPIRESDNVPSNRAIAKVGTVYGYWQLMADNIDKYFFDFSELIAFNMLPLFINKNNHLFVLTHNLEKKYGVYDDIPFERYINKINYGGDRDFCGVTKPETNINIKLTDGSFTDISFLDIGITYEMSKNMFTAIKKILETKANETTNIVLANLDKAPAFARTILTDTQKEGQDLEMFNIARFYMTNHRNQLDLKLLDVTISFFIKIINEEFSKNPSESPTTKAVKEYASVLKEMYEAALPYYQA